MQQADSLLNSQRQELAEEYAKLTRRLSFVELIVVAALLMALVFGGLSARLGHLLAFPQPWASALYLLILAVGLGAIVTPLTYYQDFVLPHRYGLSNQRFGTWLLDVIKVSALGILLALGIVIVVYWLLGQSPDIWWLWAGILLLLLSLLLTWLTPTLLLPLFFKLEPLDDVVLKQKLTNLAERARTHISDVVTMDLSSRGTTANAMLAGLGKTKRIILSDTLLQQYSPEEIEVILAHELGHHLHRDIPKLIAVQAAIALLAFYLANLALKASIIPLSFKGIDDVTAFPLLVLTLGIFSLAIMPLVNTYSRHLETMADETALELTSNPQAFVTAMTKLADQNLTVSQPSRWVELLFYDHPPYARRVSLAWHYLQEKLPEEVSD